jgi:hypothetical protein
MIKKNIKQHITKNCTPYTPVNKEKYKGSYPIICRSTWETAFCKWADGNENIILWSSEDVSIKYQDPNMPIKNGKPKFRTYYPDFLIQTIKGEIFLIEVKPYKETTPPKRSTRKSNKTIVTETKTWRTNQAKWRAAKSYCKRKGWEFKIITERELFGKK